MIDPFACFGGNKHIMAMPRLKPKTAVLVKKVYLVEHLDAADVVRVYLIEHFFNRKDLRIVFRRGSIDDMQDQIRPRDLIER